MGCWLLVLVGCATRVHTALGNVQGSIMWQEKARTML